MAAEITSIVPLPTVFGFTGLPENFQTESFIPRAEFLFANQTTIPVPQLPQDNQVARFELELPFGFAYVAVELTLQVSDLGGDFGHSLEWSHAAGMFLRDAPSFGDASFTSDQVGLRNAAQVTGADPDDGINGTVIYQFLQMPTVVAIAREPHALCQVTVSCLANDGPEVLARLFARFLQYDVRQAHHYQVNMPSLTR